MNEGVKVIETYPELDYTLVYWEGKKYQPWVVAWGFKRDTCTWAQGHYFCKGVDALEYIIEKLEERKTA